MKNSNSNKHFIPQCKEAVGLKLKPGLFSNPLITNSLNNDYSSRGKTSSYESNKVSNISKNNSVGSFDSVNKYNYQQQGFIQEIHTQPSNSDICMENPNIRKASKTSNNCPRFSYEKQRLANKENNNHNVNLTKREKGCRSTEKTRPNCQEKYPKMPSREDSARRSASSLQKSQISTPVRTGGGSSEKGENLLGLARTSSYTILDKQSNINLNMYGQDMNQGNGSMPIMIMTTTSSSNSGLPTTAAPIVSYESENILKLTQENKELMSNIKKLTNQLKDERNRSKLLENELEKLADTLTEERDRYQEELLKISNQIKKLKNVQNLYMNEKKNCERLENHYNQKKIENGELVNFIVRNMKSVSEILELILLGVDARKDPITCEYTDPQESINYPKVFQDIRKHLLDIIAASDTFHFSSEWKSNLFQEILSKTKEQMKRRSTSGGGVKLQSNQTPNPKHNKHDNNLHMEPYSQRTSTTNLVLTPQTNKENQSRDRSPQGRNRSPQGVISVSKSVENLKKNSNYADPNINQYIPTNNRLVNLRYLDKPLTTREDISIINQREFSDESFSKTKTSQLFDDSFLPTQGNQTMIHQDIAKQINASVITIPNTNNASDINETHSIDIFGLKNIEEAKSSSSNSAENITINKDKNYDFPRSTKADIEMLKNKIMSRKNNLEARKAQQFINDQSNQKSTTSTMIMMNIQDTLCTSNIASPSKENHIDDKDKSNNVGEVKEPKEAREIKEIAREVKEESCYELKDSCFDITGLGVINGKHMENLTLQNQSYQNNNNDNTSFSINLKNLVNELNNIDHKANISTSNCNSTGDHNSNKQKTIFTASMYYDSNQSDTTTTTTPAIATTITNANIQIKEIAKVIAKYDFNAQKPKDLSFSKGDIIQVTEMNKNGWWIGICHNKVGYFPYNYVQIINPNS